MQLENPLLQFDFSSLAGRQGGLLPMPELQDREQQLVGMPELQGFPALLDSGFNRQAQRGPVYALAPQVINRQLYGGGDPSASPAGFDGPANVSIGDVAMAMAGMTSPIGALSSIAGLVGQSIANTMASDYDPNSPWGLIGALFGIRGPEGVSFGDIDSLGLGFGAGDSGYGGDSPGGMAGGPGDANGDAGMGGVGGTGAGAGGAGSGDGSTGGDPGGDGTGAGGVA